MLRPHLMLSYLLALPTARKTSSSYKGAVKVVKPVETGCQLEGKLMVHFLFRRGKESGPSDAGRIGTSDAGGVADAEDIAA